MAVPCEFVVESLELLELIVIRELPHDNLRPLAFQTGVEPDHQPLSEARKSIVSLVWPRVV